LGRLGQLIGRGGADADRRALVVLDLDGDEAALMRLAVAVAESCGASDLAARVGERSLAVLMRREDAASLARACGHLRRSCLGSVSFRRPVSPWESGGAPWRTAAGTPSP
jgi:hypothetical protein